MPPVSFNNIPADIRVPLFYAEVDPSQAGGFVNRNISLLVGQKLSGGIGSLNTPYLLPSVDRARQLFGLGSILARMAESYRLNDVSTELWAIAVGDGAGAVAASGTVTITGPASAAGTLALYIAGQRVLVGVASGNTATQVAAAIVTAVNAKTTLPATAANAAGVVTLTARHAGAAGNSIDVRMNYRGTLGGENTPAGLTVAIVAMGSGATNPDLATVVASMGEKEFDYIALPYTDTTSLDAIGAELNDAVGRWSPLRQVYGHAYSALSATVSAAQTAGQARNDPHVSILGYYDSPTPPWEVASAFAAQAASHFNIDPARPLQTLPLLGMLPPAPANEWTITERDVLLHAGIAPARSSAGIMRLDREITTYQKNVFDQPDASLLDATTPATLTYILRSLRDRITQKFPRHKLANDGTRFGDGQAIVTPNIIRAELIAHYAELESLGLVENVAAFKAALIVERDALDPNRVNVLYTPDLVNQLRIFAVLAQFRLSFSQVAA